MKIGLIGATGNVGQVIYQEALSRGHQVTAVVRNGEKATALFGQTAQRLVKDAMTLTKADLQDFDVVIYTFAPKQTTQNLDLVTKLVGLFRNQATPRFIFVTDSSSLVDDHGEMQLAAILKAYAEAPWIDASAQQVHELQFLQWVDDVDWTVMTPQNDFIAGDKQAYRLGTNQILTNSAGQSTVTFSTFASAMLDEIDTPAHRHQQMTVVDD
ncbi:NAD(P)-dependent oxidoreductase [Levilactobacillus brevis]|uniref:NAD(P)-dependent oxidoreductase n=1 Tax=Levilactobacillus brevis TaxID=1580 RepID=UPI001BDF2060|nr:NAD(P)H-binding protein [Levilactobacillus brevis]